jgi:hypothetical protein
MARAAHHDTGTLVKRFTIRRAERWGRSADRHVAIIPPLEHHEHMAQPEGRLAGRIAPVKERAEAFLKRFEWTWTNSVVFSIGVVFFLLISVAVIPSFWLYYADQVLQWDGGAPHKILPFLPWTLDGFWLKEIRDGVAMGLSTGPLVTILVVAAVVQNWRRRLRGAASDSKPTGGYR